MYDLGYASVQIIPSMRGVKSRIESQLDGQRVGQSVGGRITSGIGTVVRRTGAGVMLAAGGLLATSFTKGFGRLTSIENAEAQLEGLGHSSATVAQIMDSALAAVKGTSFGMDEAATTAAGSIAAGIKPGEQLEKNLRLIGDAATIGGTSLGEMGSIFNKVATSNKVQGDVIAQLSDRGIPIVQLLSKELGVSAEETLNLAKKGEINFATFSAAMESGVGGAALKSGDTTKGAFKNMFAAVGRVGANLLSGVFPKFKTFFSGITDFLGPLEDQAKIVGQAVGKWLGEAADKAQRFVSGFQGSTAADALSRIKDAAQGLFDLIVGGDFTGKLRSAFGWEEDSRAVDLLLNMRDAAKDLAQWVTGTLVPALGDLGRQLGGKALDAAKALYDGLLNLGTWAQDNQSTLQGIAEIVGDALVTGLQVAGDAVAFLVDKGIALAQWANDHKIVVAALAGVYLGLKAAVVAHTAAMAVQKAGGIVAYLGKWLTSTKLIQAATKAWTAVQWLLNAALSANPIGLVVVALAAVAGGLWLAWKYSDTFREKVTGAWDAVKEAVVGVWEDHISPVLSALAGFVTGTLVPAFQSFWSDTVQPVLGAIGGAILGLWEKAQPILASLGGFIRDYLTVVFRVWSTVVEAAAKLIWASLKVMWERVLRPIFSAIYGWIRETLMPWFSNLASGAASAFVKIRDRAVEVWETHLRPIFSAIYGWIRETLMPWLSNLASRAVDSFNRIKNKVKSVWSDHVQPAFKKLRDGLSAVRDAFGRARDGIESAWNKVRQIVAKPIVAIVGFVNDGIIGGINKVLGWAGVSKISKISVPASLYNAAGGNFGEFSNRSDTANSGGRVALASGGVMPGYSPGRDDHHFRGDKFDLSLAGGEAIMRPEWTRAVGAGWVNSMNAMARTRGAGSVRQAMGFASGGVVGNLGGFLASPTSALKSLLGAGLDKLTGNPFASAASGAVGKIASSVKDKLLGYFTGGTSSALNAGQRLTRGMSWQNIWALVKAAAPEAIMTSNFRAKAKTLSGFDSYHGRDGGRAVDFISSNMRATFNKVRSLLPWSELYYSPMGARQLQNNRPHVPQGITKTTHYDHIHGAYNRGGVVKLFDQGGRFRHGDVGVNLSGKSESVFTDPQLKELLTSVAGAGGKSPLIENLHLGQMDDRQDTLDELVMTLRGLDQRSLRERTSAHV